MDTVVVGAVWQFTNQDQAYTGGTIRVFNDGEEVATNSLAGDGKFWFEVEPHKEYTFGVYDGAGKSLAINPSKLITEPGINTCRMVVIE